MEVFSKLNADLKHHKPALLIAHNMEFDRSVVLAELLRIDAPLHLERLPVHCTMKSTVNLCRIPGFRGDYKWPTLSELHRAVFGHDFDGQHNAAADVQACARCYFAIRSGARSVPHAGGQDAAADDPQELIGRILEWAESNDSFDTSFVESMQEALDQRGGLSDRQLDALRNIIRRWRI